MIEAFEKNVECFVAARMPDGTLQIMRGRITSIDVTAQLMPLSTSVREKQDWYQESRRHFRVVIEGYSDDQNETDLRDLVIMPPRVEPVTDLRKITGEPRLDPFDELDEWEDDEIEDWQ